MMQGTNCIRRVSRFGLGAYLCATLFASMILLGGAPAIRAQAPNSAASGPSAKDPEGFTPGWGFGTRFEGSSSGDGSVFDLGTGLGYNFSHHFGIDMGVPYYFIGTPSSIKQKNPTAVSGNGIGDVFADLKTTFPGRTLNYASTIHLTGPIADKKKGLSTGHATWNWSNHFDHGWGNFTPFIDGGVGNTIPDTRFFRRPFIAFGYSAQFEGGTEIDAGPFSLRAAAYDVAPWGTQTVISRVFRCSKGTTCSATGTTTDRKSYTTTSVASGGAALTRDNGFDAGIEVKPLRNLDLEFDYTRSVPLRLNIFSFGISVDISGMMRSGAHH